MFKPDRGAVPAPAPAMERSDDSGAAEPQSRETSDFHRWFNRRWPRRLEEVQDA